jgi:hypothetical protein
MAHLARPPDGPVRLISSKEQGMRVLVGIAVLLAGIAFPMGMLIWLNGRMKQQPALASRQTGLLLALNGILPLGLVLGGLWLIRPAVGASTAFKAAIIAVGLAVFALLVSLWWIGRDVRPGGGQDAG